MINPPLLTFSTARSFLVYHREDFFHSLSFNLHRLSRWFSLTKKRRAGRNSCSAFAWGTEEYFRPRCGNGAPTTAWEQDLPSYGFPPASVPEGFQRASGKPFGAPAGAYPLPRLGIDAPTSARVLGLSPYGFLANFDARRFPKGERKALWCARRRIPLAPDGDWRADYGAGRDLSS